MVYSEDGIIKQGKLKDLHIKIRINLFNTLGEKIKLQRNTCTLILFIQSSKYANHRYILLKDTCIHSRVFRNEKQ